VAGTPRGFLAAGVSAPGSLNSQGGNPNGCPIPGLNTSNQPLVQAVAVNFVAVGATGAGDLVAWPADQSPPGSSILNYANSASLGFLNIANMVIVPVRQANSPSTDIKVLAQASGTHLVADVLGYFSLESTTQGQGNVFLGPRAGNATTTGTANIAMGYSALQNVTAGQSDTALGNFTLNANTTGFNNTAVGDSALQSNIHGTSNTGVGALAANSNVDGGSNTALGTGALEGNVSGNGNTAVGENALILTGGSSNTAVGVR
jgi:hypothetical protein